MVRTSERGDFKRCQWLWYQHWIKGYSIARPPTWSWFGTAIHEALRARYPVGVKRGKRAVMLEAFESALHNETRRIWTDARAELDEQEVVDARELGIAMLNGYVEEFGEDKRWEVIHTEQPFQIDVVDPETGEALVIYCGTWDVLMRDRDTGKFWLWDHKTRRSFKARWDYLYINDQAGSYLWVAPEVLEHMGVLEKGTAIEGIIFNYLKKTMPTTKTMDPQGLVRNNPTKDHYLEALRSAGATHPDWWPAKPLVRDYARACEELGLTVYGEVSKVQPGPRYAREETFRSPRERVSQATRVLREARQMQWILEDPENRLTKTPTEDCDRCPFFDWCQLDEQNPLEGKEFARTMMVKRDPYRDHREAFAQGGVSVTVEKEQ